MTKPFIGQVSLFAADPARLSAFYSELLGLSEVTEVRSPIFVALDAAGVRLGFHALEAYALLNLADRRPTDHGVACYFTFEVEDDAAVERLAPRAVALGGRVIKAPYDTYYDARQVVLGDPEDNVFRINHARRHAPGIPR